MNESDNNAAPESTSRQSAEIATYYTRLLEPVFRNRDFVVIGGPIVGLSALAGSLRKLGANRFFLLGSSMGTGPLPDPELADWYSFDHRSSNLAEEFKRYEATLRNLPIEARNALDRFDKERADQVCP